MKEGTVVSFKVSDFIGQEEKDDPLVRKLYKRNRLVLQSSIFSSEMNMSFADPEPNTSLRNLNANKPFQARNRIDSFKATKVFNDLVFLRGKICSCPKALCVDDCDFNLAVLTQMLSTIDITSDTAINGQDAITKVQ